MNRNVFRVLIILALLAGAWWAWQSRKASVVPAETKALEQVEVGIASVEKAAEAVKQGRAIIRRLPWEVKKIEQKAVDASASADLGTLADRANDRIREWVRQHPTGNAVGSPDVGAGAVLAGGSGAD